MLRQVLGKPNDFTAEVTEIGDSYRTDTPYTPMCECGKESS